MRYRQKQLIVQLGQGLRWLMTDSFNGVTAHNMGTVCVCVGGGHCPPLGFHSTSG